MTRDPGSVHVSDVSIGDTCVIKDCPLRRGGVWSMCSEPAMVCAMVWCSGDPEDMSSYENWVAEYRNGDDSRTGLPVELNV